MAWLNGRLGANKAMPMQQSHRGGVVFGCLGDNSRHARLGEGPVDQGTNHLSGIALALEAGQNRVADLDRAVFSMKVLRYDNRLESFAEGNGRLVRSRGMMMNKTGRQCPARQRSQTP
jgi:hypothetical protein